MRRGFPGYRVTRVTTGPALPLSLSKRCNELSLHERKNLPPSIVGVERVRTRVKNCEAMSRRFVEAKEIVLQLRIKIGKFDIT